MRGKEIFQISLPLKQAADMILVANIIPPNEKRELGALHRPKFLLRANNLLEVAKYMEDFTKNDTKWCDQKLTDPTFNDVYR